MASMRDPLPVKTGSPNTLESFGEMAVPSTMMPSGVPRAASHRGKRLSRPWMKKVPTGSSPAIVSRTTAPMRMRRPARLQRVASSTAPASATRSKKLEGRRRKPTVFERMKNISVSSSSPRSVSCFLHWEDKDRQFCPLLQLLHQPAFEQFVLGAFIRDEVDQVLGDDHGAVVIGDHDVVREDRAAAATDRLVPADKCQLVDRGGRSNACAPDRQAGRQHAMLVAHHAVGNERGHAALDHTHAQDIAEYAGAGHTHRVGDNHAVFRHGLDGAARRNRLRPAFRCRKVLAHRHKAECEGRTGDTFAGKTEGHRAGHPRMANSLLQQHRGDGAGRNIAKNFESRRHDDPHAGFKPRRSSRRLIQATNGIASSTIQSLPMTWPNRNSSDPNASHKNTIESTINPTMLDAITAATRRRRASGV